MNRTLPPLNRTLPPLNRTLPIGTDHTPRGSDPLRNGPSLFMQVTDLIAHNTGSDSGTDLVDLCGNVFAGQGLIEGQNRDRFSEIRVVSNSYTHTHTCTGMSALTATNRSLRSLVGA